MSGLKCMAQSDPALTQYFNVPTYYNPAAAGETDLLRLRGGSRLQWMGIENAPRTFLATADMPFKLMGKRFGTGLVVEQESIGLYHTLLLGAQIDYQRKLFGGTLAVG
ncbi:MAG: type IX secretion system membrane protein PorP/SprF, partial [Muribaculaceae bacterium]|nr:type IX secretion system membrane protein PorP/SprF [Muribaculaceae bacterium]